MLATYGVGEGAETLVAARGATVRSVDDGASATLSSTGVVVLTLAMESSTEVLALAHANEAAAVTVVRSTGVAGPALPDRYRPAATGSGR